MELGKSGDYAVADSRPTAAPALIEAPLLTSFKIQ
jgi:hypothetical protein